MSMADDIAAGLEELESELADSDGNAPTFVWAGGTYPCCISTLQQGDTVIWGGTERSIAFTITVRDSVLPVEFNASNAEITIDQAPTVDSQGPPTTGKKLTQAGRIYRIAQRKQLPGAWQYVLIDPNAKS